MSRIAELEAAIVAAPSAGVTLADLAATQTDGRERQVAPLAWWLARSGRVAMSPDCTRWRAVSCSARCGIGLDPALAAQGLTAHPGCEPVTA